MILAGQFASEGEVERFYAEARSAARLQHPNIVAIHEVGKHENQHYFSMDYIEGKSLSQIVRESPLPAEKAAALSKNDRRSHRVRPSPGHAASRFKALKRPHRRLRPAPSHRFRPGQAHRRHRPTHSDRHTGRHPQLHAARAGRRAMTASSAPPATSIRWAPYFTNLSQAARRFSPTRFWQRSIRSSTTNRSRHGC